jgi:hypothetical protein
MGHRLPAPIWVSCANLLEAALSSLYSKTRSIAGTDDETAMGRRHTDPPIQVLRITVGPVANTTGDCWYWLRRGSSIFSWPSCLAARRPFESRRCYETLKRAK